MKKSCTLAALLLLNTSLCVAAPAPLTHHQANQVIAAAEAQIKAEHSTGCAAVVDQDGLLLAFQRFDSASPGCIDAALGKARTSALYHTPSVTFMQRLQKGETTVLAIPHALALGGGYPLTLEGQIVGAVGISTPIQALDNHSAESASAVIH